MSAPEKDRLQPVLDGLRQQFGGAILDEQWPYDDLTVVVAKDQFRAIMEHLKGEGFDLLLDVAGVDLLEMEHEARFYLHYNLLAIERNLRIKVRVDMPEDDMKIPTISDIWESANWGEREAFDFYGFEFVGHPNLARILTHREFEGHALRKDYPLMKGQWATTASDLSIDLERE
jgi:NADH-quinone oxidoreductase subunit C